MKRLLSGLLAAAMLCGVLVGCAEKPSGTKEAGNTTNTEETQPTTYPKDATAIKNVDELANPPETVYSTPAEENGLGDTMYKIDGVVKKHVSAAESGTKAEYVIIETASGQMAVLNPLDTLPSDFEGLEIDADALQSYFQFPQENERVCIYAQYLGYSDNLDIAAAIYGGQDYLTYACLKSVISVPDTEAEENSSQTEVAPQEEQKPKEYTFTAGNYYVGEDIPEGRYNVAWISGRGNCFGGGMIESFGDSDGYIKEYKNVELPSGDKVEVSGTLTVKFISK